MITELSFLSGWSVLNFRVLERSICRLTTNKESFIRSLSSFPNYGTNDIASSNYRRAVFASRFLRPPARCKRAQMREKPRRKVGAFENPVRRFVRLREKARAYSEIPPPRIVPLPKCSYSNSAINNVKILKPIRGVPKVDPVCLQNRLDFYLLNPENAKMQQMLNKMRPGLTPYQCEMFMYERQIRDIRKIYRAQYLQKLEEVTDIERIRQMDMLVAENKERTRRRLEAKNRLYEDRKRRAVLKDRLRIEKKVSQAIELAKLSRRKKFFIHYYYKLQNRSDIITGENSTEKILKGGSKIFNRNVSVPKLVQQMGLDGDSTDIVRKSQQKTINEGDDIFSILLEESFKILPEDAPQFEGEEFRTPAEGIRGLSDSDRASLLYSSFSEKEKLELVQKKIEILNEKIDNDTQLRGGTTNLAYVQLRDHLEAAKQAYLEKDYVIHAKKRAKKETDGADN